jgi:gamma-D-glutamyl-L-lysine dipeptidyl-peptidase
MLQNIRSTHKDPVAPEAPTLGPVDRLCSVAVAAVRAEPREDAERVTELLEGESVRVEEERDGWARIVTAYEYPGWVRAEVLAGREGDPVAEARAYLGAPYLWGGLTERGIDCSWLVHMAYRRLGLLVPRDAAEQEAAGTEVATADLWPGDLVTYGDERETTHVAFWLGDGRILHATGREGVASVVEEVEPGELRATRRRLVRLAP